MGAGRGVLDAQGASGAPAGEPLASVARRGLAWVADVVLVTMLILAGIEILDVLFGPAVRFREDAATLEDVVVADTGLVVADAVLATLSSAAYFAASWALLGASPGQLLLRLRVRAGNGRETLSLGRALARWLVLFPPFATVAAFTADAPSATAVIWAFAVAWYLLLLVTTALSDTRQGLHDRVAGSTVRRRAVA